MAVLLLISNLTRLLNHTVFKNRRFRKTAFNSAWIFGMSDNWKTIGHLKMGLKFTLWIYNHGRSMQSLEFSYELMAQDLNEYCVGHNLTSIDLLGHSMGGKTAMLLLNILK
jgi:pimeloyl-ACP methyl ester carboxylesterase